MKDGKHKCIFTIIKDGRAVPCPYTHDYKAAVINHIKGNHPGKWLGNWDATMGVPGAKPGLSENERRKRSKKRQYGYERQRKSELQARKRAENIAAGLTSAGKPRRLPLRQSYLQAHGMVSTPTPRFVGHYRKRNAAQRVYNEAFRLRNLAKGLTAQGKSRKRAMTPKMAAKLEQAQHGRIQPIVYRAPRDVQEQPDALAVLMNKLRGDQLGHKLNHCPSCGLYLAPIQEAMIQQQVQNHEQQES